MYETTLGDQLVIAVVAAWAIEQLKQSKYFPFITQETSKLNRAVAALLSALGTVGILVGHTWSPQTHTLTITISGLSLGSVLTFAWRTFGEYIYMKIFYHAALKPSVPASPAHG